MKRSLGSFFTVIKFTLWKKNNNKTSFLRDTVNYNLSNSYKSVVILCFIGFNKLVLVSWLTMHRLCSRSFSHVPKNCNLSNSWIMDCGLKVQCNIKLAETKDRSLPIHKES